MSFLAGLFGIVVLASLNMSHFANAMPSPSGISILSSLPTSRIQGIPQRKQGRPQRKYLIQRTSLVRPTKHT